MAISMNERQHLSQYSGEDLSLALVRAGQVVPVDGDLMTVQWVREDPRGADSMLWERTAELVDGKRWVVPLEDTDTEQLGPYTAIWRYKVDGRSQQYRGYILINEPMPAFDALSLPMREIVTDVWARFADAFDSPYGGPNLQTYYQSHFNLGRMAQLLKVALGQLNTSAQPYMSYTLDGSGGQTFPLAQWGPLLSQALYIETIRHLIRSYVEQYILDNAQAQVRPERRDYLERWQGVLNQELSTFQDQLETFKIAHMGLGRGRLLVSGGLYGRWGYGFASLQGVMAARGVFWSRVW